MGTSCYSNKGSSISHNDKDIVEFPHACALKTSAELVFIVDEASEIGMSNQWIQKYAEKGPHKLFIKNNVEACFKHGRCEDSHKDPQLFMTQEIEDKTVTA